MKKLIGIILIVLICGFKTNSQQSITVSGITFDSHHNLPISGIDIAVKGTDIGTQSNEKGEFTISFTGHQGIRGPGGGVYLSARSGAVPAPRPWPAPSGFTTTGTNTRKVCSGKVATCV